MDRHLTYLALLVAACCFFISPVSAEVACEDMPCCAGTVEAVDVSQDCQMSESSEELMDCGDSADGCSCSLQSEAPVTGSSEAILTFVRYQFLAREIEILELPDALLDVVVEKPVWFLADEVPRDDFFLALHAFPNPPPAAA